MSKIREEYRVYKKSKSLLDIQILLCTASLLIEVSASQ
jgi:hypothetical protein